MLAAAYELSESPWRFAAYPLLFLFAVSTLFAYLSQLYSLTFVLFASVVIILGIPVKIEWMPPPRWFYGAFAIWLIEAIVLWRAARRKGRAQASASQPTFGS